MLHPTKNLFLIAILTVSLAGCSGGSQTGGDASTPANSSPAASPVSDSGSKAPSATSTAIPGVKDASEVKFNTPSGPTQTGFFDTVNDASTTKHNIEQTAQIKMAGWAVLPGGGKIADRVIITLADNKTILAVVPVNLGRPDVAKSFKNPAYQNSGWNATINASALPEGQSVLKAWAYNSATKEAIQLGRTHEITID